MIDDWAKILDNQGQVDTFILDFEKAFDTPPHEKVQVGKDQEKTQSEKRFPLQKPRWEKTKVTIRYFIP